MASVVAWASGGCVVSGVGARPVWVGFGRVEQPGKGRAALTAEHDLGRRYPLIGRRAPFLAFLAATEKAGAVRTLESLARIELGAQGSALVERVTTTRAHG